MSETRKEIISELEKMFDEETAELKFRQKGVESNAIKTLIEERIEQVDFMKSKFLGKLRNPK